MKTYENVTLNIYYTERQRAIQEVCNELNLEMFKPNYHGEKDDGGTVIIYTKDNGNGIKQVCHFESTDVNGHMDFAFLNRGQIDLRGFKDIKNKIKKYIEERL